MSYDLISRSALLGVIDEAFFATDHTGEEQLGFLKCRRFVRTAPAIDAEPVRHGRWMHLGGDEWCCTQCGEVIHTEGSWEKPTRKYCHECGARMDGDADVPKS